MFEYRQLTEIRLTMEDFEATNQDNSAVTNVDQAEQFVFESTACGVECGIANVPSPVYLSLTRRTQVALDLNFYSNRG